MAATQISGMFKNQDIIDALMALDLPKQADAVARKEIDERISALQKRLDELKKPEAAVITEKEGEAIIEVARELLETSAISSNGSEAETFAQKKRRAEAEAKTAAQKKKKDDEADKKARSEADRLYKSAEQALRNAIDNAFDNLNEYVGKIYGPAAQNIAHAEVTSFQSDYLAFTELLDRSTANQGHPDDDGSASPDSGGLPATVPDELFSEKLYVCKNGELVDFRPEESDAVTLTPLGAVEQIGKNRPGFVEVVIEGVELLPGLHPEYRRAFLAGVYGASAAAIGAGQPAIRLSSWLSDEEVLEIGPEACKLFDNDVAAGGILKGWAKTAARLRAGKLVLKHWRGQAHAERVALNVARQSIEARERTFEGEPIANLQKAGELAVELCGEEIERFAEALSADLDLKIAAIVADAREEIQKLTTKDLEIDEPGTQNLKRFDKNDREAVRISGVHIDNIKTTAEKKLRSTNGGFGATAAVRFQSLWSEHLKPWVVACIPPIEHAHVEGIVTPVDGDTANALFAPYLTAIENLKEDPGLVGQVGQVGKVGMPYIAEVWANFGKSIPRALAPLAPIFAVAMLLGLGLNKGSLRNLFNGIELRWMIVLVFAIVVIFVGIVDAQMRAERRRERERFLGYVSQKLLASVMRSLQSAKAAYMAAFRSNAKTSLHDVLRRTTSRARISVDAAVRARAAEVENFSRLAHAFEAQAARMQALDAALDKADAAIDRQIKDMRKLLRNRLETLATRESTP